MKASRTAEQGRRPSEPGASPRRPSASLRAHFLFIVVVALVPLLLFSAAIVTYFAYEQRNTLRRGGVERTRALLTAVDTELKRSIAALEALATSERIDSGELDRFFLEAHRVRADRSEWLNVHLALPSGVQVLNLLRPPDEGFRAVTDSASFTEVVRTRAPVAGSLFTEPYTGKLTFPVRVPVARGGELLGVLTALVDPGAMRELLTLQDMPHDWVGVVVDSDGTIVARTIGEDRVGGPASPSLRAALEESSSGWFSGHTLEGWPVYTPFHRSRFSGWTVGMGIPVDAIDGPLWRSVVLLVGAGILSLASGIALAWVRSRRSARSLEHLVAVTEDLGLGRPVEAPVTPTAAGVAEIEALYDAFARAQELITARSHERDRVEISLLRVQGELRASEQRKDQFLAMLGHELRNPLGVIVTAVKLLQETTPADSPAAEPTAMIERQARHMRVLLNDLLDVSRIARGRIEIEREPCELGTIVRETVQDHRKPFAATGLRLELDAPDEPVWVRGDAIRLAQVLGNLLNNAMKYTDAGGRVDVELRSDKQAATATLVVRDSGVGMEPEILEHAFEAFTQADGTIARSRGGLGLGLPLVKGLVEEHGGSVRASSEGTDKGTEVVVRLPLAPAPDVGAPEPVEHDDARSRVALVIEDNEMAARAMQLLLSRLGHTVEVAHTGPEGLEAARRLDPELVLCDIGLPGLSGHDVARALRRTRGARPYLIAISGYGQSSDRRTSAEAGFDAHMIKPVDFVELRRILASLDEDAGRRG